jgi:hypothetical protein
MRPRKRHALLALPLALALVWWLASEDEGRVAARGRAVAAAADDEPERAATTKPRTARRRPPLVLVPPSTDTAEPPFDVAVWFETKSGEPLGHGFVVGCGYVGPRYVENGARLAIEHAPCTATGMVEDGFLVRRSEPADIDPETGEVTFTFPDERTGGIGIRIAADEGGIRIESVLKGGPADDLGLEAGDVVVAVEGKDASEISLAEFVETMTGPEGSDVEFVLRAGGENGDDALETVTVTRRFLGT